MIPDDLEILDPVVEHRSRAAHDFKGWCPRWRARQLLFDQRGVVEIEVDVAPHPHQLAGFQIALLRQHSHKQRRAPQVERQPKRDVAATLVKQAVEATVRDMKLVGLVARRQGHGVKLGDVPAFDDVTAAARIGAQAIDHLGDLIDSRPLAEQASKIIGARRLIRRPIDPLLAIDRAKIAPLGCKRFVLDDPPREIGAAG